MSVSPTRRTAPAGLRERNRERTRQEIQRAALRLFVDHGYEETTVEQICESAGVSVSTFFRYFPTKEELVVYDAVAPAVLAEFLAQPAELTPLEALVAAMKVAVAQMPAEQLDDQRLRSRISREVPALRAAWLREAFKTFELMGELLAQRLGREHADLEVRAHAGALHGAMLAASLPLDAGDGLGEFASSASDIAIRAIAAGLPLLTSGQSEPA